MKVSSEELSKIIAAHALWLLAGNARGVRANLRGTNLRGADLESTRLPGYAHCPEVGEFIAFKKLVGGVIAKLKIPADAGRTSSLIGRKCRAEYVIVMELSGEAWDGGPVVSTYDNRTIYAVGETVRSDNYDPDIRVECTNGIHFFITRKEAEDY